MSKDVRRGFVPEDDKEFTGQQLVKLKIAAEELQYLLDRGYKTKNASTFIGNHYLLSERQRLALVRSVASKADLCLREERRIPVDLVAQRNVGTPSAERNQESFVISEEMVIPEVNIDGFNTIITLEVALSGSPVLNCMDGCIRDLAGLRGTYRIIDKTELAVELILKRLMDMQVEKANFYLDAPVSNSGRLKTLIEKKADTVAMEINIFVINDVDRVLEKLPYVITSDVIILNHCQSWINLNQDIIKNEIQDAWSIKL